MQRITYVARRSIISGHSAETAYTMDLILREKDPEIEAKGPAPSESMSGRVVTTLNAVITSWRCETPPLPPAQWKQMREFLDSALDGQYMTFDPEHGSGGISVPSTERLVILKDRKYTPRRFQTGTTQDQHYFSFSFVLREV